MSSEKYSKDFACNHREYLPCRFAHLDGEVYRCSHDRLYVLAGWVRGDEEAVENLVKQACPPIKKEGKFIQYLARINEENANELIKNAEVGDLVFCFQEIDGEVILLEKPETNVGNCVYKNKKGEIRSFIVRSFRTLSKGDFLAEYLTKGDDSEIQSQMIKRMAGEAGFRVEIEEKEKAHLVKIFGDSQQEVDDFMTLCVYNKFIIY